MKSVHTMIVFAAVLLAGALPVAAQSGATSRPAPIDQPTRITLHMKNAPPQEIFKQLSAQLGSPLETENPSDWRERTVPATVSVDIDNKPFWEAMQEIARQTHMRLDESRYNPVLRPTTRRRGAEYVSGPCLFSLTEAIHASSAGVGSIAPSSMFTLSISVMIEPRLRLMGLSGEWTFDQVTDDKGNWLLPPPPPPRNAPPPARRFIVSNESGTTGTTLTLEYPRVPGKRFTSIRGSVKLLVQTKSEVIEIPNIRNTSGASKTVLSPICGPITLTVQEFQSTPRQYLVKALIAADESIGPGPMWSMPNAIQLRDAKGVQFPRANVSGGRRINGAMEVTLSFNRPAAGVEIGEPEKLVWEIATAAEPLTIPFEFTDLPMP